jgi:hypothetical protein
MPEAAMEHSSRRADPHEVAIALLCRLLEADEAYLLELARRLREPWRPEAGS